MEEHTPTGYRIVRALAVTLSRLPFPILYLFADLGAFLLRNVIRYRRDIIANNIATAFPEADTARRREIERGFYRWFADYFVETLKLLTISPEELRRRLIITNPGDVEKAFAEGQSAAAILGHYCNWEWLSAIGIGVRDCAVGLIYHPLRDKTTDRLFRDIRAANGGIPIPKRDILRRLVGFRKEGRNTFFGYIADQAPKWENIHLWVDFFGRQTPVFTGGERIMRKIDDRVFYAEMTRPRRGYYQVTFHLLATHAAQTGEHEITRRFFERLEADIRRAPQYYLWSHNRWKRTREEFDRRFRIVNGKVVPQ